MSLLALSSSSLGSVITLQSNGSSVLGRGAYAPLPCNCCFEGALDIDVAEGTAVVCAVWCMCGGICVVVYVVWYGGCDVVGVVK